MAKGRVNSGLIEKRLGGSGGRSRGPDDPESGDGSSGGNTLFAVSFVVILIAGSGALVSSDAGAGFRKAFWEDLMGPPPEPAYQSRVAAVCDKGWRDDRNNIDQIDCYMTTDIGRLCDPHERRALADKLVAYQIADDRLIGRAAMTFLGGYSASNAVQLGMAEAKSRDPHLSEDERAAQRDKVTGMAEAFNSPTQNVLAEGSANTHGIDAILDDVKNLAELGYLAASDFPEKPPKFVREGLAAAGSVSASSCPKR